LHRVDDLADVVDAGVGGGIHLDDIDVPALDDGAVVDALLAEIEGRMRAGLVLVVEGAGEDARGRGLADAADAGEHEGVRDAARGEGVAQRRDHRVLADERIKARRAVFPRQDEIRLGRAGRSGLWGFAVEHRGWTIAAAPRAKEGNALPPGILPAPAQIACGEAGGWQRPVKVSLGLLPSGPDPVGEEHVRTNLPAAISGIGGGKARAAVGSRQSAVGSRQSKSKTRCHSREGGNPVIGEGAVLRRRRLISTGNVYWIPAFAG